jgi:hypothetical protein
MFKSQSSNNNFLYTLVSELNVKDLTGLESYRGMEGLQCRMVMLDGRIRWNKYTINISQNQ